MIMVIIENQITWPANETSIKQKIYFENYIL